MKNMNNENIAELNVDEIEVVSGGEGESSERLAAPMVAEAQASGFRQSAPTYYI